MSPRRVFRTAAVVGGLVLAVGGAIGAARALRGTRAADLAADAMIRERQQTESAAPALEGKIATLAQQRATLVAAREKPPVAATAPKSSAPTPPRSRLNSPEEQAKQTKEFRAKLRLEQFPFYRAAGLTEKEVLQLEDILTEHDARGRDIQVTAREQRLPGNDPAIAALRKEEAERYAAELRGLLGDDGRRRFDEFRAGVNDRRVVADLVGNLALTSAPLTPEQGQRLTALLGEVGYQKRQTELAMWNELFQRGQTFLTAPQVAELRALRAVKVEIGFEELRQIAQQEQAKGKK